MPASASSVVSEEAASASSDGPPITIELLATSKSPTSVSTRLLHLVRLALEAHGVRVGWTDRRQLVDVDAGLDTYPAEYEQLRRRVREADAVILAHGVHGYSVPGPTKTLADILGSALVAKPFAIVTAAGSSRSHLAIRDLACSIVLENGSPWIPLTVQVAPDPSDSSVDPVDNAETLARVEEFVAGVVHYVTLLAGVGVAGRRS